jgi:hypothetical protein
MIEVRGRHFNFIPASISSESEYLGNGQLARYERGLAGGPCNEAGQAQAGGRGAVASSTTAIRMIEVRGRGPIRITASEARSSMPITLHSIRVNLCPSSQRRVTALVKLPSQEFLVQSIPTEERICGPRH